MEAPRTVFVAQEEGGYAVVEAYCQHHGAPAAVFTIHEDKKDGVVAYKPFDDLADKYDLTLRKVKNINAEMWVKVIQDLRPDIIYVVMWSQLLCDELIAQATIGTVGFHGTLLPKHRGRAPIPWSIIHGLRRSGVTMFWITPGVDNGAIIGQQDYPIQPYDDARDVYDKAAAAHVHLIQRYHPLVADGTAARITQDEKEASYWPKRVPNDGLIDWDMAPERVCVWIRALTRPFPGAFTYVGGKKLYIWKAEMRNGTVRILESQWEGQGVMSGDEVDGALHENRASPIDFAAPRHTIKGMWYRPEFGECARRKE